MCAGADQGGSQRGSGGDDRSGDRDLIFVGLEEAGFRSRYSSLRLQRTRERDKCTCPLSILIFWATRKGAENVIDRIL